jgi:arginine utilization protein RocB
LTINVNGRDKTDKQLAKMVRKEATEAFGDLMDRMSDKYKPVREV